MATKHTLGDRIYVFSNNATPPGDREDEGTDTLFFLSHGFFKAPGKKTKVAGVSDLWFACKHGETSDPDDVVDNLKKSKFPAFLNSAGFRYTEGKEVEDYTFKKELDEKAKATFKDKDNNDYQFVNGTFCEKIYPANATFDLACMHNTWKPGRTIMLSDVFKTLSEKASGKYKKLLVGSCREVTAK